MHIILYKYYIINKLIKIVTVPKTQLILSWYIQNFEKKLVLCQNNFCLSIYYT